MFYYSFTFPLARQTHAYLYIYLETEVTECLPGSMNRSTIVSPPAKSYDAQNSYRFSNKRETFIILRWAIKIAKSLRI